MAFTFKHNEFHQKYQSGGPTYRKTSGLDVIKVFLEITRGGDMYLHQKASFSKFITYIFYKSSMKNTSESSRISLFIFSQAQRS